MAITYNNELEDGFVYVPLDQRGEKDPFTVTIKPMESVVQTKLQDGLLLRDDTAGVSIRSGSFNIGVLSNSIIDWSGIVDNTGKPIKIRLDRSGFITEASLNKIPATYFEELAGVSNSVSQDPATLQLFVDGE